MRKRYYILSVFLLFAVKIQSQNTCAAPTNIAALPYSQNGTTSCGTLADYSGGCMLASHSTGADRVYAYTPSVNSCISVSLTDIDDPSGSTDDPDNVGLYVIAGCPTGAGTTCIAKAEASLAQAKSNDLLIGVASLTAGITYYIIVDAQKANGAATACFEYDISITSGPCPKPPPPPLPTDPQGVECGSNLGFESGNLSNWNGCRYDGGVVVSPPNPGCVLNGPCPQTGCQGTMTINGNCTCINCGGGSTSGTAPCCPLKCDVAGLQPAGGTSVNGPLGGCEAAPANAGNTRHTVTNGAGTDPNSDGNIPVVAPGGRNYSVRIGNHEAGWQSECLEQTFAVTKDNALFTYLYAVVLQDPSGHADDERPRFEITLKKQNGDSLDCGGNYTVISKYAAIEGFEKSLNPQCGGNEVWYKRWTAVATDLSAYIGQNVTIKFCTADCGQGGHFGYAYVDTYCRPLEIQGTNVCTTGGNVTLSAPQGFSDYSWYSGGTPVGNPVATTYTVSVPAVNGAIYTAKLQSIANPGCFSYITDTIEVLNGSATGDTTLCTNATGPVTLTATSTDPANTSYSWTPATGLSCTTCPNPTVNPPYVTRTYSVTMTSPSGCTVTDAVTITANVCSISVVAPSASICPGACVSLTATASGGTGPYTYTWTPGGTTGSTLNVCPTATSTYTVTARDAVGLSATTTAVVSLNTNPSITSTPQTICAGSCTSLTASGAGAGGTYTWTPAIGTGAGPHSVCPTTTTTYTVRGTTTAGCSNSTTVLVTVNPNPVLAAIPATICAGDNATITANGANTYTWSTGATGPSITVSPTVTTTYTVSGTTNGCTGSATVTVTINNGITVPVPPATICIGSPATLTAGGSAVSYTWSTGASTQSITVSPTATTTYTVSGTSASGCTGTGSVVVTVNPLPVITTIPATICIGSAAMVSASGAATYTWNTGATGPSLTVSPAATTTYTVTGTSAAGCTGTATVTVTVNPNPVLNVSPVSICEGDNATLTVSGAQNYTWSTGATTSSVTVSPTATTTYTVIGRDINGCTGTTSVVVTVNNNISVSVPGTTICTGGSATLTANGPGGTTYTWSTGQTGQSITVSPLSTTTYSVSGTSPAGCTGATTVTVVVTPVPQPAYTTGPVCLGNQTCFTDQSSISAPGSISSWSWSFGDGSTSNQQNPCHIYANPGTYTVGLSVTSDAGCTATYTSTAVVNPPPAAGFTVSPVCLNQQSCFVDQSTTSSGTVSNWTWTFGDNSSPSNHQNPCHIYPNPGTYTVTLIVQNNFGCRDTVTSTTVVNPLPVANFNTVNVCQGSSTRFTDGSSAGTGSVISNWLWNFGDNGTSSQQNPTHTYAEACTYTVTLTVTTDKGCISNTQKNVEVYPNPIASFTSSPVCQGSMMQFTNQSSVAQAGPNCTTPPQASTLSYSWNFGDGGSSSLTAPGHTYTSAGSYVVTLTVTSNHGCVDIYSDTVTVHPLPAPAAVANRVCLGSPTIFTDSSTVTGGGSIVNWTWNFADPPSGSDNSSNLQHPTHIYTAAGVFTPSLSVTNSFGCVATTTLSLIVDPNPIANFTATAVCQGLATIFTDQSTVPLPATGTSINSWSWDFGDGGTSVLRNPSHTYAAAGQYTVTLIVRTSGGCIDTIQKPVDVWAIPVPYFGPPRQGCMPVCVDFTDSSTVAPPSVINKWVWNFGDLVSGNSNIANIQNPQHCYQHVGIYSPGFTVTTDKGCSASLTRDSIIVVHPYPKANFTHSPQAVSMISDSARFYFTDLSSGAPVSWRWTFERSGECDTSAIISTVQNPSRLYCDTGTFQVCLKIENQYGCPDSICKYVVIGPEWTFFIPNAFSPNGDFRNEYFKGKSWNVIEHEMWIYDRWGNMIYYTGKTRDPESAVGWDGRANSGVNPAQEDVYVWVVKIKDIFGKGHKLIGHVTLVK